MSETQVLKRVQIAVVAAIAALAMGFTLSVGTASAYAADDLQAGKVLHTQSQLPVLTASPQSAELEVGASATITISNSTAGQTGKWTITSSDSSVATVTPATATDPKSVTITVTGVAGGTAKVNATFSTGKTQAEASVAVTVNHTNAAAGSGASKGTYTVAGSTAVFVATTATGSTIKVPDTITIDGKTYPVTSIAPNAFKKSKVKKVTVGSNVVTIGANAWNSCKKLTALTIGKGVTKMGANMCKGAKKLKTITIKSKSLTKAGVKKCLKGSKVKTVKVPKAKVKAYKKIFTKKICGAKVKVKKG